MIGDAGACAVSVYNLYVIHAERTSKRIVSITMRSVLRNALIQRNSMNNLCCHINPYIKCTLCQATFCDTHWEDDRTHVSDTFMRCPSKKLSRLSYSGGADATRVLMLIPAQAYLPTMRK